MIFAWIRFGLCALCLITAMICFTAAVLGANRFGELKLCFIIIFMWFTSPVSSHILIQVEYFTNPHLYEHVKREGLEEETEEDK